MARRRSRLGPTLVALGLALALSPLVWPDGDGPVDAVVAVLAAAVGERAHEAGIVVGEALDVGR